jgi:magnesium transporter
LDSLIFNDEVDAYQGWTLFLVGLFITILIGGVVMLTNKKPPPPPLGSRSSSIPLRAREEGRVTKDRADEEGENAALNIQAYEEPAVWEVGELSDDEDGPNTFIRAKPKGIGGSRNESSHLMEDEDEDEFQIGAQH